MVNNQKFKISFKVVIIFLLSFLGIFNCVSMYKIGKKINSKLLKILSLFFIFLLVVSVVAIGMIESETLIGYITLFLLLITFVPTIISLSNISKYKNACVIQELIDKWNIDVATLTDACPQNLANIKWANSALIQTAEKMYKCKGKTLILEINNKMEQKQAEETKKAETIRKQQEEEQKQREESQRLAEEKRLEELRLQEQIEKEKRLAEEKRLEGIRVQEQLEREKLENDNKFKEMQKQHAINVANLQEEKHAAEERELKLQEQIIKLRKQQDITPVSITFEEETKKIQTKFCHQCGTPLIEGKNFCINCGTKN